MSDALFLDEELPDPLPPVGSRLPLTGDEGRHAAVVRRLRAGERVLVADGRGRGVRGLVLEVGAGLVYEVAEHLATPPSPLRFAVVQALAKGDRAELAVEMLTELGVEEIVPWQASRSVVRWSGERGDKSLARWRSTVREAAKQSRRLAIPAVGALRSTRALCADVAAADLAVVLHEEASTPLADVALPTHGTVLLVVGPEGGISPDELSAFTAAGAVAVTISDGVLRTSTAGVVALAGLKLRR